MSVSEEDIILQSVHARLLIEFLPDSVNLQTIDILDCLSQAGLKLQPMTKEDCDEEGLSLTSKAYMFSVIEQIQNCHYNSKNSDSLDINDEDFDLSMDDDPDFFQGD